jgi:hypothetical protein
MSDPSDPSDPADPSDPSGLSGFDVDSARLPWGEGPLLAQLSTMGPRGCCSDLDFDRVLTNEATAEQRTALETHLSSSPACQARFTAHREEWLQWQSAPLPLPALSTAAASPSSSSSSSSLAQVISLSSRRAIRWGSGLGAAAAAAVVVLAVWGPTVPEPDADVRERLKGLGVTAQFGVLDGADLFDGDTVPSTARVRAHVTSKSDGVAVVSSSADGTTWQPIAGPTPVHAQQPVQLLSSTLAANTQQIRVLVCNTEAATQAFDGAAHLAIDHPQRPACVVDTIGVHVEPRP